MTVVPFKPENGQKLENIPHMLRFWADELEAGREPMPDSVLMVLVGDGNEVPEFCVFGSEPSRTHLVGLFSVLAQRVGVAIA